MPRIPWSGVARPKAEAVRLALPRKPRKKRRTHSANLSAAGRYLCPLCGPLGDLSAGVAHAVANQFVVVDEDQHG